MLMYMLYGNRILREEALPGSVSGRRILFCVEQATCTCILKELLSQLSEYLALIC